MKSKQKSFQQSLYHHIEDEDKAEAYLEQSLPLIGRIVMDFNGLESSLDSALCEIFSDRTDSFGLIVLHKMGYSAKVDLLKRFCDDMHLTLNISVDEYEKLIDNLKESGSKRNLVVHADWESTNEEGYTYVSLRLTKQGMKQEYFQFSYESLGKVMELIWSTRNQLDSYWEARESVLSQY